MINFNSTSSILIVTSILTIGALYFVGLAVADQNEIVKFGYDTSFLVLIIGYILRQKNIQQLMGLFLYLIYYNLDLLKGDFFQIQNIDILYFASHNAFYFIIASFVFLFPTLIDKYKFAPLTNRSNIKDALIILTAITMKVLIQTTIRLSA